MCLKRVIFAPFLRSRWNYMTIKAFNHTNILLQNAQIHSKFVVFFTKNLHEKMLLMYKSYYIYSKKDISPLDSEKLLL